MLSAPVHALAPAAPSNCTAVTYNRVGSTASIELRWNDNSMDTPSSTKETQWIIQYSVDNWTTSEQLSVLSSTGDTTGLTGINFPTVPIDIVFRFRILAYNGTEYSGVSNVATVGTFDLNSPINLSVTAVDPFNVMMSWEEGSTSESGFAIECKVGTGAWIYLGAMDANSLALNPTNLIAPLTSYSFRIRAFKGSVPSTPDSLPDANVSAYSNIVTVSGGAYTLVAGKVSGKPIVNLSWPDIQNETGYQIIYKESTDSSYTILDEVGANITTYQVLAPQISPGKSYSFIVRPFAGSSTGGLMGQSSEPSVTVDAYTPTVTAVPYQPIVNLSWASLPNATKYQIWYLAPDSAYAFLNEVDASVTSSQYTVPNIEPGKSYSFVVVAFRDSDILCDSSEVRVAVDGITSKTGTSSTVGSPFFHTFTHVVASGSVSTRTLTGIPSTLTFDSDAGTLSGVYPALGNYTMQYTVNFTGGGSMTQTFYIRVRSPEGAPLVGTLIPAWSTLVGATRDTPLTETFSDPEAESAVRVDTTLGSMDFILFDTATPATVKNFMSYVNSGKYTDVMFHRSASNFVIQGGGFYGTSIPHSFTSMMTYPSVVNEPGIANVRGTISMAKSAGDPNSATSQFFVSLNDNRGNLDYQNGGFTVFGRVAGNGMAVADAMNALPVGNYTSPPADLTVDGNSAGGLFSSCPMNAATAPDSMDQNLLVKVNSVTTIPTLSYQIADNTNPSVASAEIVDGKLHLIGLSGGHTTVTVTAADLDNLSTSQIVEVDLTDTYDSWKTRNTFIGGQDAPGQDPDADGWTNVEEYAFLGDPSLSNNTSLVVFSGIVGVAPVARYLTLTFPVRKATTGLSYVVEANDGLSGTWSEIWKSADGFSDAQVVSALDEADRTVVTIKDDVVFGARTKRFLRIKLLQE